MTFLDSKDLFVSTDACFLDRDWIVKNISIAYWGSWRSADIILKSVENSLCFGLYWRSPGEGGLAHVKQEQIGFARVVTDYATVSWVCDVIIDPLHRGRGYGKFLMSVVVQHPAVARTVSLLGTRDAHKLYELFGYERKELMRRIPKNS